MGTSHLEKWTGDYVVGSIVVILALIFYFTLPSPTKHPGILICLDKLALPLQQEVAHVDSDDIYYDGNAFHVLDKYGHYQTLVKSVNDYCVTVPRELNKK